MLELLTMKIFLLILLIIACFAFGPGVVLLALVSIPMLLSEWIFHAVGSPESKYVAWAIWIMVFGVCLFPFISKKGV
jgi:TRAP-type mannitol/chloroaromatic compound transport system permease small subunit